VLKEFKVLLEELEELDQQVLKDSREIKVFKEPRELKVQQVLKEFKVLLEELEEPDQ
jgi:flagellar biosynthesis/type III secretory pathway chaperone